MYAAVFSAFIMGQIEQKVPVYKSFSTFESKFSENHHVLIKVLLGLCLALGGSARAQVTANWTGKGNDSLWTDSKNWDTHSVPSTNDTANIDLTGSNLVILDTNLSIGTINLGGQGTNILQLAGVSIQCTGSISINTGGILDITGNSVVVGGSVQNSGSIMVPANLGTESLTLMSYFTNSGVLDAETNSVLSLPGTNSVTPQLLAGTVFSGLGAVQFPAGNAKINCSGTMSVTGTVQEQQAVLGSSTWVGPGLFQWLSGSISNVTFAPNLTVELSTSSPKFVYGTCTNQGTMISLAGAGGFTPNTNAVFFNTGLFQLQGDCSLGNGAGGIFHNNGTVDVPPGLGPLSLTLNCNFFNNGTIDVESNSTLAVARTNVFISQPMFSSGTLFEGPGILSFPTNNFGAPINLPIFCTGTITVNGTVELNVAQVGGAVWTGSGLLQWFGSPLFNPTFAPGFHVEITNSDPKAIVGVCTNQGTIHLVSGDFGYYGQTGDFYNQGVFEVDSNCNFTSGLTNFINSGTITVPPRVGELSFTNHCNFVNDGTIDVETNSILDFQNIIDATATFESGTVFDGAGTFQFVSEPDITCDGLITVNGTVVFNAIQVGDATWTGSGLLQFTVGTMNNVTFAPGFNVQIIGPDSKTFDGACTNGGTMRLLGTGEFVANPPPYNSSFFYNTGLFQVETNLALNSLLGFQNTGVIKLPAGFGALSLAMMYTPFTNYGVIDVETNSTLSFSSDYPGSADFESGTVFDGKGAFQFASDPLITTHGQMTVNGTLEFNAAQQGDANWTGPGLFQFILGSMNNVTFAPGFNVQLIGTESKNFGGTCTNLGTIRLLGTGDLAADAAPFGTTLFCNAGLFQIETNFDVEELLAGFKNSGTITVPPGFGLQTFAIYCPFTNSGVIDVETNSELDITNDPTSSLSSQTYLDGSVFNGPGLVLLPPDQVACSGTITVNGTLELAQTLIRGGGPSIWTGTGLLLWQNGEIDSFTFATNFHASVSGFEPSFLSGNCTNLGTICLTNDALEPDASAFYNYGSIHAIGASGFQGGFTPLPVGLVQNSGIITVPPGLGSNSLTINCNFTNNGTICVGTNSELVVSTFPNGSQTYLGGSIFNGSGTVSFVDAGFGGIQCSGSITDNCALTLQSGMSGMSTWTGSGGFGWLSGTVTNITFAPGFHAQISGPNPKSLNGVCTNQGTVCWLGGSQLNDPFTSGQFYNSGTLQITTDGTWNNIPINNTGTFRQLAGSFSVPSFSNIGSVQEVSGFLNVATNFVSGTNSSYQVTLSGTTPGSNFNQLNAQNLSLNGSLQVILTNGFSPAIGNSFAIMSGTRSNSFSSTALPPPQNNLVWSLQYAPAAVVLEVAQPGGALTNMGFVNGTFQFSLNGSPSGSYDIQASTNLIDWTTILTNYPFSGSATVTDTNVADFGNRFFRARFFP